MHRPVSMTWEADVPQSVTGTEAEKAGRELHMTLA